jgi:long-chain fatty acid transport protein
MIAVHRVPRIRFAAVILAAALAAPLGAPLSAQGFGVSEIGACAVARGYAATATPCQDASTIYWNPAAATSLSGWSFSGGVSSIALKGRFTQDTTGRSWNSNAPTAYVPNVFLNYHAPSSQLAWGIGVYVPYGLTSQWPADFPGSIEASKASISTFYVQPNVAWQINPVWSVGGGPIVGHSSVQLIQGLDLSQQVTFPGGPTFAQLGVAAGTDFAQATLKGSATAYGAQVGVQGRFSDGIAIGARYLTPLEFTYSNATVAFTQVPTGLIVGGDVQSPFLKGTPIDQLVAPQFAAGGLLVDQAVSTKIVHPAQLQAGISYSGYQNWLLEADYAWEGWRRFASLPLTFANPALDKTLIEDYNNTSAIRLGAEYTEHGSGWTNGVKLRAGFVGVASAAPPETVTPLLPEQDRSYGTFGIGLPLMSRWAIDATYAHIWTPGARGRIVERTSESQTAAQLNTGVYNLSANIFSLTLKASF